MVERRIGPDSSALLLLLLSIFLSTTISLAQAAELPEHIDNNGPFHLSWNTNQTRWDFIFSPKNITAGIADLKSLVSSNSSTITQCGQQQACILKGGTFLRAYNMTKFSHEKFTFISNNDVPSSTRETCKKFFVKVHNHCSTHWNPLLHITGDECQHTIEWHSPYSCSASQTNYEHPCYVYDQSGKLIDLTHLIQSNGSAHEVSTGDFNNTVTKFHLNICNEATKSCGSNVSSCRSDNKNLVETGYNNLTSIKYDSEDSSVRLVYLGEFNEKCPDKRTKTTVKFECPKQYLVSAGPKLVKADDCENNISWPTVRACPEPDVQKPATDCAIKYEPLGIDINLRDIFVNQTVVEVFDMDIGGKKKSMMLGLCEGISPTQYRCAGKSTRMTSACLIEGSSRNSSDAKNSEIVGKISKSTIKLEDSRIILESYATNKTCDVPVTDGFNYARQVGTRIEFVCAQGVDLKPKFIAFEDCVYVFEWGSSRLCLENMISQPSNSTTPNATDIVLPVPMTNQTENISNNKSTTNSEDVTKTAHEMHQDTVADSKDMLKPEEHHQQNPTKPQELKPEPMKDLNSGHVEQQPEGKMNKVHKFFMIGLIVMSLTAFVVVIFILDKKTNFKIPLGRIGRRARQAFRPQPVPYSRVSFNDNLDL